MNKFQQWKTFVAVEVGQSVEGCHEGAGAEHLLAQVGGDQFGCDEAAERSAPHEHGRRLLVNLEFLNNFKDKLPLIIQHIFGAFY